MQVGNATQSAVGLQPGPSSDNRLCGLGDSRRWRGPDRPQERIRRAIPVVVLQCSLAAVPEQSAARAASTRVTWRLVLLGALLAVLGCGALVERAPFSFRADSLTPGDLLGPFDGMVVDAETD